MVLGIAAGLTLAALMASLVGFIITLLVEGFVIYVAGRIVVGAKATFGGAFKIALLGTVIGFILGIVLPVIGTILALIVWLYLIKSTFDTGWLAALAIGIMAVVVSVAIVIVLVAMGVTMFALF
jgi:hypothetical protein